MKLILELLFVTGVATAAHFPMIVQGGPPKMKAQPNDNLTPSGINVVGLFPSLTDPTTSVLEVEACNKYFKFEFKTETLRSEQAREALADEVLKMVADECAKR